MQGTNHDTTGHEPTNQPVSGPSPTPKNHSAHHQPNIDPHPAGVPYSDTPDTHHQPPIHPDSSLPDANKPSGREKFFGNAWGMIKLVGGSLIVAIVVVKFLFQPYQVYGLSMVPTLDDGDRLIIVKIGKTWASLTGGQYIPNRGEIVVFKSPAQTNENLIKRVIGLPGDRVLVSDGIITIFNSEQPGGFNPDLEYEDTLPAQRTGNIDVRVGEGELFVSGDNRTSAGSLDSRNQLGLVPVENLVGELVLRIVPLSDAKFY